MKKSSIRHFARNLSSMAGLISYEYPEPGKTVLVDIHQYSGIVTDWDVFKRNAVGVLIKLTDGTTDAKYGKENWEGARRAGVPRGAWGWLYKSIDVSVNAQARKAVSVLRNDPGELPFFFDFETTKYNYRISNPEIGDLWSALDVFETESGREAGIYTGYYYWLEHGSPSVKYKRNPLWIASYNKTPVVPQPWGPGGQMLWQFTEKGYGKDYGINQYAERAVDLNYFNGTRDEFYKMAGVPVSTRFSQTIDLGSFAQKMKEG